METTISDWSKETFENAQKDLEKHKQDWETEQLKKEEEKSRKMNPSDEDEDWITYSGVDSKNQVTSAKSTRYSVGNRGRKRKIATKSIPKANPAPKKLYNTRRRTTSVGRDVKSRELNDSISLVRNKLCEDTASTNSSTDSPRRGRGRPRKIRQDEDLDSINSLNSVNSLDSFIKNGNASYMDPCSIRRGVGTRTNSAKSCRTSSSKSDISSPAFEPFTPPRIPYEQRNSDQESPTSSVHDHSEEHDSPPSPPLPIQRSPLPIQRSIRGRPRRGFPRKSVSLRDNRVVDTTGHSLRDVDLSQKFPMTKVKLNIPLLKNSEIAKVKAKARAKLDVTAGTLTLKRDQTGRLVKQGSSCKKVTRSSSGR